MLDFVLVMAVTVQLMMVAAITARLIFVYTYNFQVWLYAHKHGDPSVCMCGSSISDHSYSDTHQPLSEVDWFIENNKISEI